MLTWLWNALPASYRWEIAIKKVSYMAGKLLGGFALAHFVNTGNLTPEQAIQIELAVTTATAMGLEAFHDWAKLKWPDKKWL